MYLVRRGGGEEDGRYTLQLESDEQGSGFELLHYTQQTAIKADRNMIETWFNCKGAKLEEIAVVVMP